MCIICTRRYVMIYEEIKSRLVERGMTNKMEIHRCAQFIFCNVDSFSLDSDSINKMIDDVVNNELGGDKL